MGNMFYNIVKEYAEDFKKQNPDSSSKIFCAVLTRKHDIFKGVTGLSMNSGVVESVEGATAEHLAIKAMIESGQTKVRQMIMISLSDFSVIKPDEGVVAELLKADEENSSCEIFVSDSESLKASELSGEQSANAEKFFEDFAETEERDVFGQTAKDREMKKVAADSSVSTADLGAPADFADGFDIDVTNPFYEPPTSNNKEVITIADEPVKAVAVSDIPVAKKSAPEISKDELLKQAKKKKKIAKNIFSARRK